MQMPKYYMQAEKKSKRELIQAAVAYYFELTNKKLPKEKARKMVLEKIGVVL